MRKSRQNVYLLGDGKGRRKEMGEWGVGSSSGWHCKRTRWNGFSAVTNWRWRMADFTGPSCAGARWTAAMTSRFKTQGWGMLSSQRGKLWSNVIDWSILHIDEDDIFVRGFDAEQKPTKLFLFFYLPLYIGKLGVYITCGVRGGHIINHELMDA